MTPNDVNPTREILFIKRDIEDDKFGDSALVRPDQMKTEMGTAEVLAVGPEATGIAAGDKVYLGKLAGLKVVELDGPYFLVHQNEILAVVGATAPVAFSDEAPDASGSVTLDFTTVPLLNPVTPDESASEES